MKIFYFSEIQQLRDISEAEPSWNEEYTPMTGNIVVVAEFQKRSIRFIDEWAYLTPEEIERHRKTANELANSWYMPLSGRIKEDDIDLLRITSQEFVYPFEIALNAHKVYERVFDEHDVEKIEGYFLPQTPVIRTGPPPVQRATGAIAQAILFWLAEKRKITLRQRQYRGQSEVGRPKKRVPPITIRFRQRRADAVGANGKPVIVWRDLMHDHEYATVRKLVETEIGGTVIPLSSNILMAGPHDLSRDELIVSNLRSVWREFQESNRYSKLQGHIFQNKYLGFQFEGIWRECARAVRYGDLLNCLIEIKMPKVFLVGHDAFIIERYLVQLVRSRGIRTVSLFHGGMGHRFTYCGIVGESERVLVWNTYDEKGLVRNGVKKERIRTIGSLQYSRAVLESKYQDCPVDKGVQRKSRRRIGVKRASPVVLIVTAAINAGFASPIADPNLHLKSFFDIIEWINLRQDLQFVIKPHPSYDYYEMYESMRDQTHGRLIVLKQGTLEDAIKSSDVCVLVNYMTTAGLEAMIGGIPLVYLNSAVYPLKDWAPKISGTFFHTVASVSQLRKLVDKIIGKKVKSMRFKERERILDSIIGRSSSLAFQRQIKGMLDSNFAEGPNDGALFPRRRSTVGDGMIFMNSYVNGLGIKLGMIVSEELRSKGKKWWKALGTTLGYLNRTGDSNGWSTLANSLFQFAVYPVRTSRLPKVVKKTILKGLVKTILNY